MRHCYLAAIALLAATASSARALQHDAHAHAHATAPTDSITSLLLARQLDSVRAAVARYSDIEAAKRDGFVLFGRNEGPLMGEHWFRNDLVHKPFDITRPSTLQYATINGKKTLVGVAYTVYRKPADPMPSGFAGESDHWHVHNIEKLQSTILEGRPVLTFLARRRAARTNPSLAAGRTELTMVHVWTGIENPDGPFAEYHRALPYLRAGLPASHSKGATENAAWGIALVQPDGCENELRSTNTIARLSRQQHTRLDNACSIAAAKVLKSFREKNDASALNAAADAAWSAYLAEREKTLTVEQKKRMASAVEHPMAGG